MLQYVFGYANVQLQAIIDCGKGTQLNKDKLLENGYPVINGGIKPSGYWNAYNYLENTITICQGGNAGYTDWQNSKFWAGAHCYVLTNNNQNVSNYRYIYFALKKSEHILMQCKSNASTIPGLPIKNVNKLMVQLPSIPVQEKIVNILNNFDSYCNDLVNGLPGEIEARKKQYEYYRDKLLTFSEYKEK